MPRKRVRQRDREDPIAGPSGADAGAVPTPAPPARAGGAGRACRWPAAAPPRARRARGGPRSGGAPRPPSPGPRPGPPGADHEGHQPLAPLGVGHPEHLGRAHAGCARRRAATAGVGHVDPSADHHVVEATRAPAGVRRRRGDRRRRSGTSRRPGPRGLLGVAVVAVEEGGPADRGSGRRCRSPAATPSSGGRRRRSPPRSRPSRRSPRPGSPGPGPARAAPGRWGRRRAARCEGRAARPGRLGSSSIRCSWVGTSETKRTWRPWTSSASPARRPRRRRGPRGAPARAPRPASGTPPGRPRRTTAGSASSHGPARRGAAPRRHRGQQGRARRSTRLGRPVEPEVSTTRGPAPGAVEPAAERRTALRGRQSTRPRLASPRVECAEHLHGCERRRAGSLTCLNPRRGNSCADGSPAPAPAPCPPRSRPCSPAPASRRTPTARCCGRPSWPWS